MKKVIRKKYLSKYKQKPAECNDSTITKRLRYGLFRKPFRKVCEVTSKQTTRILKQCPL